jgi:LysR family hca operon transcriptional activator
MQVDAAVDTARMAAQPERKTFAIGFQTGLEMSWLPQAMHVLQDELKNIHVNVTSDYSPDLAEALAPRPPRPRLHAYRAGLRPRVPRR